MSKLFIAHKHYDGKTPASLIGVYDDYDIFKAEMDKVSNMQCKGRGLWVRYETYTTISYVLTELELNKVYI